MGPPGHNGPVTPGIEREWAPFLAAERPMLEAWLEYHRATLVLKCEGLGAERLAEASVPPSDLSLLGLVRHMAEVERNWFQRVFAGVDAPPHYCSDADAEADFDRVDPGRATQDFETFEAECAASRAVAAQAASLDAVDRGGGISLRWIMLHMIEEYARHNGHADLLRERIDGATGG